MSNSNCKAITNNFAMYLQSKGSDTLEFHLLHLLPFFQIRPLASCLRRSPATCHLLYYLESEPIIADGSGKPGHNISLEKFVTAKYQPALENQVYLTPFDPAGSDNPKQSWKNAVFYANIPSSNNPIRGISVSKRALVTRKALSCGGIANS